jgi:hypothetical protein
VSGCYGDDNEPSDSIKDDEIDCLFKDCQFVIGKLSGLQASNLKCKEF